MRVGILQFVITLISALLFFQFYDWSFGVAAGYGGAVALINFVSLYAVVTWANIASRSSPERGVVYLYVGAAQRLLQTIVLMAVGMGVWDLKPEPLLITFGVCQLAFMISGGPGPRPPSPVSAGK